MVLEKCHKERLKRNYRAAGLVSVVALLLVGLSQSSAKDSSGTNNCRALECIRFADQFPSLQAAIDDAYAAGGGDVWLSPSAAPHPLDHQLKMKNGVRLRCMGATDHDTAARRPCVLQPIAGFPEASILKVDPANVGKDLFISGVGVEDIAIDMTNVATSGKIALELRSVSNTGPFRNLTVLNQDNGQYLFIGTSSNAGAFISEGLTFEDFFTLSKTTDPRNVDPGVIIEEANEIDFIGGRTKIMRRSTNGGFAAGSVGVLVRSNGIGANHVNLEGISIAGYETALKVARVTGIAPRWVRLLDSTIENFRYGMHVDGDSVSSPQFFIGRGNRFITPRGSNPRNYLLDHAQHGSIETDEFADQTCMPGCRSSLAVELTANSMSNKIYAMPAEVSDAGKYNIVLGRSGAIGSTGALWSIGTGQQISVGLAINSATSGSPQLLLQRDGRSQGIFRLNSTFIQSGIDILDGTGQGITLNGSSLVPTANGSALGVGGKAWAGTFTAVNTSTLQLTSHARPACDAAHRGLLNYLAGGTGVKDTVEICLKDAADAYSWKTIY